MSVRGIVSSLASSMQIPDRTASNWISLANSEGSRNQRRHALKAWLIANDVWEARDRWTIGQSQWPGLWKRFFATVDRTVLKIRSGKLDACESVNRLIDYMNRQNRSSSSTIAYRSFVIKFLRYSRLGIDWEDAQEVIRRVRRVYVIASKFPSRDQIRAMLLASPLKTKVMISMLISTGARLGEVLKVRRSDIDFNKKPVMVYINEENKTGRGRACFLSSETVNLLQSYLRIRGTNHEYLFNGHDPYVKESMRMEDRPMARTSAWLRIRRAFERVGLSERYNRVRYFYHPNGFRGFSLALMKTGGFPADWAEYLVGHYSGSHAHYAPPYEVLASEWLKVEPFFCFLTDLPTDTTSTRRSPDHARRHSLSAPPPISTQHWSSRAWDFIKTQFASRDYDQALADGYSVFDRDDSGVRILRKRRTNPS